MGFLFCFVFNKNDLEFMLKSLDFILKSKRKDHKKLVTSNFSFRKIILAVIWKINLKGEKFSIKSKNN